jgi:hypothetical protein
LIYRRYSGMRVVVENTYGDLKNLFHLLSAGKWLRIYNRRDAPTKLIVSAYLLLNCYTCFNGSSCQSVFGIRAPLIEEYLPVDNDFREALTVVLPSVYAFPMN